MTDAGRLPEIEAGCRDASWGCVDCKRLLLESMERFLTPIHERRAVYDNDPDLVWDVLAEGNKKARAKAQETMAAVREIIGFDF